MFDFEDYELFLPVQGFPGIFASDYGTIKDSTGEILRQFYWHDYIYVKLKHPLSLKWTSKAVHRLVLLAHDPIEDHNKYHVNHIDGCKSNNRRSNLEWLTPRENNYHAGRERLTDKCIPVDVMMVATGKVGSFPSCEMASGILKTNTDNVILATKKPNNLVHGYGWRIKRHDTDWLPFDVRMTDPLTWQTGSNHNPVDVRNLNTNVLLTFNKQGDAAEYLGISEATMSNLLSSNQRLTPDWWQVKYVSDTWQMVPDKWLRLAQDNSNIRPVKLTHPDNSSVSFVSATDCAKYLNVGTTTVLYNLKSKHGQVNKHGYKFEYYL